MRSPLLYAGIAIAALLVAFAALRGPEHPAYSLIVELPLDVEVRDYAPMRVAQITVPGAVSEQTKQTAIEPLAAYLAGANERGERIGPARPVLMSPTVDGGSRVAVILPAGLEASTLPEPDDARIRIIEIPGRPVAALHFRGRWTAMRHAEHARIVQRELGRAGWRTLGEPIAVQHSPAWLPGPLRRNEVLLVLEPRR